MAPSEQERSGSEKLFRNFIGRAVSISTNAMILEKVMKPVSSGDWEYLRPMLGEQVIMSRDNVRPTEIDLTIQLIIGVSIFRAFEAELYLKALLSSEDKIPPRSHDLLTLHSMLGQRSQSQLEVAFRSLSDDEAKKEVSYVQMPSFESVMKRSRNDFVHVRYEETFDEFLRRVPSAMMNLSTAVTAAMIVCLRHPWAAEWHRHVSLLSDNLSEGANS